MKQKYRLLLSIIPLVFLFSIILVKPVSAQVECSSCSCQMETDCRTDCSKCQCDSSFCQRYGCSWCTNQPDPKASVVESDDINGKVVNPVLPNSLTIMKGETFLQNLIRTGIKLLFVAGAVIFFFILGSGGIKWLSSSGDKVKLESAQKQVTSGLVGLAILLSVYAIIQLINTLFGIDLLNLTLPTLSN